MDIQIPSYRIVKEIGRGGMAKVYLAVQESLDREVALKIMSASLVADPSFCERFLSEGRIIAKLRHHAIVTIHDIGVHENHYYMAMELAGAGTLKQRIEQGLPPEEAAQIAKELGGALGYAHAQGFVHRDVKPANVLFRVDGSAVLSDFGIAKGIGTVSELTSMGFTVGTPHYMSPEQATGKPVDSRSDLYSLGVVFYQMLTGEKPYDAADTFATAYMHISSPIPQLPHEVARFQPVIERLLAKQPEDRYANAAEMIRAIDELPAWQETGTQIMPTSEQTRFVQAEAAKKLSGAVQGTPARKWTLTAGGLAAVLAAVLAAGGGGAYVYLKPGSSPSDGAEPVAAQGRAANVPAADLSPEQVAKIERLLVAADAHLLIGRLKEPQGANAFETYKDVLQIDPGNRAAQQGLKEVEKALAAQ